MKPRIYTGSFLRDTMWLARVFSCLSLENISIVFRLSAGRQSIGWLADRRGVSAPCRAPLEFV